MEIAPPHPRRAAHAIIKRQNEILFRHVPPTLRVKRQTKSWSQQGVSQTIVLRHPGIVRVVQAMRMTSDQLTSSESLLTNEARNEGNCGLVPLGPVRFPELKKDLGVKRSFQTCIRVECLDKRKRLKLNHDFAILKESRKVGVRALRTKPS